MYNNNSLITTEEIQQILIKYEINISTLSQLLGWGPNTISRYLSGDSLPSLSYSQILKSLFEPSNMRSLLKNNLPNISESTLNKLSSRVTFLQLDEIKQEFPGNVFIKKLNSHELGYRKNLPNKAGSFMLIPKSTINFFPTLSPYTLNSNLTLRFKIAEVNTTNNVSYIYHNSKHATINPSESRDEYRLYLTHLDIFKPNDIAIIVKSKILNEYIIYKFTPTRWEYVILDSIIQSYKVGKSSAAIVPIAELIAQRINLSELFISNIDKDSTLKELLNEPSAAYNPTHNINTSPATLNPIDPFVEDLFTQDLFSSNLDTFVVVASKIKRNEKFRRIILDSYNYKCCVCEQSIAFNNLINLQAAHIIPKHRGGTDNPTNGIPLSHDLHWAFDNGFFTILNDYTIFIHESVQNNTLLSPYHGKKILLPTDIRLYPSQVALEYHRKNVFGTFLNK